MSDLQLLIDELTEEICDQHCKYNDSIDEEGCSYCKEHEGMCYLDDLRKAAGL